MRLNLLGIPVKDQEKALQFYTNKLGFIKKHDIDLGNGHRWLTVISSEQENGPEILLEPAPLHFEPAKVYQKALLDAGIPCAQFDVDDVDETHQELSSKGIEFTLEPTTAGDNRFAIFKDTCGNLLTITAKV